MRLADTAVLTTALALGAAVAYVDSRPTWDDAGITAGVIFLCAMGLSFASPRLTPAVALAVSAWIPLIEIVRDRNYGSLIVLGIALIGALCGAGARIAFTPSRTPSR